MNKDGSNTDRTNQEGRVPGPEEDLTALLGGSLKLLQPRQGYRFALDSLALAGFCRLGEGWSVLDLGAGNGVLSLVLAQRFETPRFTLLELQDSLAGLARRNTALNGLESRLRIIQGDLRQKDLFPEKHFQAVVINPPYRVVGNGRLGPLEQRNLARHELECTLRDWTKAAARWLKNQGALFVVFPVERLDQLLAGLQQAGLIPKRLRLVHERPGGPGLLALVEARLGGGRGLAVDPPLFADQLDKERIPG